MKGRDRLPVAIAPVDSDVASDFGQFQGFGTQVLIGNGPSGLILRERATSVGNEENASDYEKDFEFSNHKIHLTQTRRPPNRSQSRQISVTRKPRSSFLRVSIGVATKVQTIFHFGPRGAKCRIVIPRSWEKSTRSCVSETVCHKSYESLNNGRFVLRARKVWELGEGH